MTVQALVYNLSLPRVLVTRWLGERFPWLMYGPIGPVRLETLPVPRLPGDDWALVKPTLAGICGTDLGAIRADTSPSASPFSSFPAVLGHEVVGVVSEAGPQVGIAPGTRVVIDPGLSCFVRGIDQPCTGCAAGFPYLCQNAGGGGGSRFAAGLILGFCRDLPGAWSEAMIAHRSQLFTVPDAVSDERAVLTEPLAIGLHAVLRRPPAAGQKVLVIGAGSIGLCLTASFKLVGSEADITVVAKHGQQADLAGQLGAHRVVAPGDLLSEAERATGAISHRPLIGRTVLRGGYDIVYDCVGTKRSLDDALRVCREGGAVVVVGAAGEIRRLDWTFVWMRELEVIGAAGYGLEQWQGQRRHTFSIVLDGLVAHPELRVERMITHRFRLQDYRQALITAFDRRRHGSIKAVFTPALPQATKEPPL